MKNFLDVSKLKKEKKEYEVDLINTIFEELIKKAIENIDQCDDILIDTFSRFQENLKELKGKAPLITGIIELLYFEFIKRYQ